MRLTVLSWNTLFAGRDGMDDQRARVQVEVINALKPDVFLMQEAKGFEANGSAWLYALESQIQMRGFLALAPHTGQNTAIFIREPLRPLSFDVDNVNFHHALATLKVALPDARQITFLSAHLCPNGATVRRREAAYLATQAASDKLTLLTGDFNSASPHDAEPEGWDALSAHHRARYVSDVADDLKTADRSVLAHLENAGFVDVAHALGKSSATTVPALGFANTEFAMMRCDYMLASRALATHAQSYEVIKTPATDSASDHYPILGTFELAN